MKKLILAIVLISALPMMVVAEEKKMRNTDPSAVPPPEHVMRNTNPSPEKIPEHMMRNTDPNRDQSGDRAGASEKKDK